MQIGTNQQNLMFVVTLRPMLSNLRVNTVVSRASTHSRVSAHVTVFGVEMESAHSRASAQVT